MGRTPHEGAPGEDSAAEHFPVVPKAPRDAGLGFPRGYAFFGATAHERQPRALLKPRGPLVHSVDPAFCPGPGSTPGVQPPAPSFTKETPLDLQMKSI